MIEVFAIVMYEDRQGTVSKYYWTERDTWTSSMFDSKLYPSYKEAQEHMPAPQEDTMQGIEKYFKHF